MSKLLEPGFEIAQKSERVALKRIERLLMTSNSGESPRIVGADGTEVSIPVSLLGLLRQVTHLLANDRPVSVLTRPQELTTQQAADVLNVSRPFLIKQLLDTHKIPFKTTGTHRRIAFDDVMAYKRSRDGERRQTLRELSALSQELNLD